MRLVFAGTPAAALPALRALAASRHTVCKFSDSISSLISR